MAIVRSLRSTIPLICGEQAGVIVCFTTPLFLFIVSCKCSCVVDFVIVVIVITVVIVVVIVGFN